MFNPTPTSEQELEGELITYDADSEKFLYIITTYSSGAKTAICGDFKVREHLREAGLSEEEITEYAYDYIERIDHLHFCFTEA